MYPSNTLWMKECMSITSLSVGSQSGIQLEVWVMFESQIFGELNQYRFFFFLEGECTFLPESLRKHEWHTASLKEEKDVLASIILSDVTSPFLPFKTIDLFDCLPSYFKLKPSLRHYWHYQEALSVLWMIKPNAMSERHLLFEKSPLSPEYFCWCTL